MDACPDRSRAPTSMCDPKRRGLAICHPIAPYWRQLLKIHITLPSDRALPGKLTYERRTVPCLGKADNARAVANANPTRDPTHPWGDAPTGLYAPARPVWLATRTPLGEAWIPLDGVQGDALTARHNGRTGLGIHAGRGIGRLVPTYGCIRLRARDFYGILSAIGDRRVDVEIVERTRS